MCLKCDRESSKNLDFGKELNKALAHRWVLSTRWIYKQRVISHMNNVLGFLDICEPHIKSWTLVLKNIVFTSNNFSKINYFFR